MFNEGIQTMRSQELMPEKKIAKLEGQLPKHIAFRTKGAEKLTQKLIATAEAMQVDVSTVLRLATEEGLERAINRIVSDREKLAASTATAKATALKRLHE